jgi:Tfp pilus assembly protein PilN
VRVPINLASHPLENLRPVRAGVALAGLTALLFGIIILRSELRSRSEFRTLIDQRDRLQTSLATLHSEQEELEAWLDTPQAQQIRERSAFLNALIQRKSLSWTQMFMDLERTLPPRARIVSIRPSLGASREADLELTAEAASMGPLVDFLKRLESSPKFGPPTVAAQKYSVQSAEDGAITIDLTTRYTQDRVSAAADAAPTSEGAPAEEEAEPSRDEPAVDLIEPAEGEAAEEQ